MKSEIDLSACADEPIRIPGSIQPHGALLGLTEPALEVVLASINAPEMLGIEGAVRGRALADVLDGESLTILQRALEGEVRDANPLVLQLRSGGRAHGVLHRSDGLLVLEIEPTSEDEQRFASGYRTLVRRFDRLRRAASVQEVCDVAAADARTLTGYDRVMVYRFDERANGTVIAESCSNELEPFLGLHYPASDIPPQARQLYVQNPLRIIVDSSYEPAAILPSVNPLTGQALDLSQAVLRSVSPIHCEYLRNMGVASSMSISLVANDRLWGLVACHHPTPHHVPYATRMIGEFLAHVLSARVLELERTHSLASKNRSYSVQTRLIQQMVAASRFEDGLSAGGRKDLTDLIPCDGAAVLTRTGVTRIGTAPQPAAIRDLAASLHTRSPLEVVSTDELAELYPPAGEWVDLAAGAIAVPISADGEDYLFWFRGEESRSVRWAGNPNQPALSTEGRLSPRGSFAEWVEQTRGRSAPWEEWAIEIASDFRTALVASIIHQAAELERLNTRLVEANQQKDRFLATVSHELRNPLNAIIGWVRVARRGLEGEELQQALVTIERNANAQAKLIEDLLDVSRAEEGRLKLEPRPLDLAEVLQDAVESLLPSAHGRGISIKVRIGVERADIVGDRGRLQQVVWNLLSNAIKFSDEGQRIWVGLDRDQSQLTIEVRDEGQGIDGDDLGTVFEPFRQGKGPRRAAGLGLGLAIVKSIVELHGGEVDATSPGLGQGSCFRVKLPLAAMRATPEPLVGTNMASLHEVSILIVEDQADSAQMVSALLKNAGARVHVAPDGREALGLLHEGAFDLVVSDLDMPVMDGFELIDAMRKDQRLRNIPAIALTAYARGQDRARALQGGFKHHVGKPVDPVELMAVIASLLGRL